jgi:capsular exopolysaccharide synthesis family protein
LSQNGAGRQSEASIEAFRILRSNVEFLSPDRPLRTIAITSPVAEEGKSTVAAGLATASALAGKRVLLLECDLRRPVLAERFRLGAQPGLTDWLSGGAQPAEVVQVARAKRDPIQRQKGTIRSNGTSANLGLATIVAGSWSPRPTELLGSDRFRELLEDVGQVYDLVVLDCAPLLPVGDSLEILPLVDALLVCIRLDQTTREQAVAAKGVIDHLPPRPTGIVITGVRPGREGYYYGYYSSSAGRSEMVGSAGTRS